MDSYGSLCCVACGYDYQRADQGEEVKVLLSGYTVRAFGRIIRNTCSSCHPQFKRDREIAEQEWAKEEADVRSQEID